MRNPRMDVLGKVILFKKAVNKFKKVKQYPHCYWPNGIAKKVHGAPTLKLVHEKYKGRQNNGM